MIFRIVKLLLKPWVIAAGSGLTTAYLMKKEKRRSSKIREAKLELIEQQRTIDRLRAELGKERFLRQEAEEAKKESSAPSDEKDAEKENTKST